MLVDLEAGPYRLKVATTYGPRLLGLRRDEGPELFAQLPEQVAIDHPQSGKYRFYGGHRLWVAPEVPGVTYVGDDHACEVTPAANGATVTAPADAAGFVKEMRVTSLGESLVVDHQLTNAGPVLVAVAAWAITQFPLGGTAIMPVAGASTGDPYQADASVIVWPYTNLADPRLSWSERAALVQALAGPRFKVGTGPQPGRLGYFRDGYLFTKEITASGEGEYPDRGAVGQVFVEDSFCELESLGPLRRLEPGESLSHRETWEAVACADLPAACHRLLERVEA